MYCLAIKLIVTKKSQKTAWKNIKPFSRYQDFCLGVMTSFLRQTLKMKRFPYIFHINMDIEKSWFLAIFFIKCHKSWQDDRKMTEYSRNELFFFDIFKYGHLLWRHHTLIWAEKGEIEYSWFLAMFFINCHETWQNSRKMTTKSRNEVQYFQNWTTCCDVIIPNFREMDQIREQQSYLSDRHQNWYLDHFGTAGGQI